MSILIIRNLPEATCRAIEARAKAAGISVEEEVQRILNQAVFPPERIGVGSQLAKIGKSLGPRGLSFVRIEESPRIMKLGQ